MKRLFAIILVLVLFFSASLIFVSVSHQKRPVLAQACQDDDEVCPTGCTPENDNDCGLDYTGSSVLNPTSCLQNNYLKICFDDVHGGAIQGLYNKLDSGFNFIYPTMGGAFQLDFRSTDPIIFCPEKYHNWGQVWNPTQAGCEGCYKKNEEWWHVPSSTYNKAVSSNKHYIEFRPRNYFHHNMGDCDYPLPYTTDVIQAEDIYVKQKTQLIQDYLTIEWEIEHEGDHTHSTDRKNYYRHELPVIYFGDVEREDVCYNIIYQDLQGNIHDESLPCKTGKFGSKTIKNSWFTIYDPNNPERKLTFANQNSLEDNSIGELLYRNFFADDNGMQLEFSYWNNIEPNQEFSVTTYVFPYKYNEILKSGETVLSFISRLNCYNNDGFCPEGCNVSNDSDCSPTIKFEKGVGLSFENQCQYKSYYVTPLSRSYPSLTQEEISYLSELKPDFVIIQVVGPAGWYNIARKNPYQNGHYATEWNNPYYDFKPLDDTVTLLSNNGIEPVLQIWGTPIWANGIDYRRLGRTCFDFMDHGPVPSNNLQDFSFFMKAVAERYNGKHDLPKVNRFLLWNEPNLRSFWAGTIEQFVQMNNFAYDKIKQVNPDAEIWGGNLCCSVPDNWIDWLTRAHELGFKFDKFGIHPYPMDWTKPPWEQPNDDILHDNLQILIAHLDSLPGYEGKHIVLTESGYRLDLGITPEQQAEWLEWSMKEANKNPRVDVWTNFLLHYYPDWGTGFLDGVTGYQAKGVWVSSQYNDDLSKEKAVDFNENTFWSSQIFSGPDVENEWLSVDLGKQTEINQIIVCPHVVSGQIFSFPKDFGFSYSDDGNNWYAIESFTNYQSTISEDGSFCQVFSFPKIKHRYFSMGATKLSINPIGNYVFAIAEFRLRKIDETSKYPAYFTFRDFTSCQNDDGICRLDCYFGVDNDCPLRGDLDNDGLVNSQDLKILLQNWGDSPPLDEADLNYDNIVNGLDFGIVLGLL